LLAVCPVQVFGQSSNDQEVGAIADAESAFLFINLLEFLAEFETAEGEWISPEILGNEVFTDLDVASSDLAGADDSEQSRLNPQAGAE